jgi:hypothetical protein
MRTAPVGASSCGLHRWEPRHADCIGKNSAAGVQGARHRGQRLRGRRQRMTTFHDREDFWVAADRKPFMITGSSSQPPGHGVGLVGVEVRLIWHQHVAYPGVAFVRDRRQFPHAADGFLRAAGSGRDGLPGRGDPQDARPSRLDWRGLRAPPAGRRPASQALRPQGSGCPHTAIPTLIPGTRSGAPPGRGSHSSRPAASTARWSYSPSSIRREGICSVTCFLNPFYRTGRSSCPPRSEPTGGLARRRS